MNFIVLFGLPKFDSLSFIGKKKLKFAKYPRINLTDSKNLGVFWCNFTE